MATVERTAYPRFPKVFSTKELQACYTPDAEELEWATRSTRGQGPRLGLLVLLKVFQQLHYFPNLDSIPVVVIDQVRASAGLAPDAAFGYDRKLSPTLYRHYTAVRELLGVQPYIGTDANEVTIRAAREAAETMDQQVDIINATIDALILHQIELPAFSTLDNIAEQIHARTQTALFRRVARRLSDEERQRLDRLLTRELTNRLTAYNNIKRHARRPSRKHLNLLIEHLTLLDGLGDFSRAIAGVPASKLRSLASQAMSLDAANLREILPEKRYTLIVALLNHMRVRTRDDLAEMFIRRMGAIHKRARDEMERIQSRQRAQMEKLVTLLDGVVDIVADGQDDALIGRQVRRFLAPSGDLEPLRESCAEVRAFSGNNYLPLLWRHFRAHRSVMLRLAQVLEWESTSQSRTLLAALAVVLDNESLHREWIAADVDVSFASERWRKLVRRSHDQGAPTNRRYLELCVLSHMVNELRSGDLCVVGSDAFADYRVHLLPWRECERRLPEYCAKLDMPANAQDFVSHLRQWLTDTARTLDASFPDKRQHVTIGQDGEPVLKRTIAREIPASAIALQQALLRRMPTRNLLDVLANIEHWTHFTRHFGPLSGSDPKIRNAAERYLLTIFAMGCNLGPTQAARHMGDRVTPHMMSFVNRRHLSLERLETAQRELIELYLRLDLPKHWGDGKTVAADGTQYDFYDNNLLAGYHFRYRKMGAVAYRHVADNYIAVFRHFIPPGVWEAIYVIEGLLKAGLSVEADTVHADTQGQSAAVFAFTHLLGIKLMPRIRNWQDLKLYRADANTKYKHIDRLFSDTVDWDLIAFHWQDLMQVALSIQAGTISSPLLLRRFGSESRRNRLFLAAQELGKVVRTAFLLEWIGSRELRQEITASTNKIESYNGFAKWFSFGGDVLAENDPDEQQKRLRYNDLIASAVILQNTADMMQALRAMVKEGIQVDVADIGFLSPYLTSNIKRFGDYKLNLERVPEAWIRDSLFASPAHSVRKPRHA
ncbi:Tn3 family transposase [Cupriavidus oxalaticus]|uniref:Transposase n=2 Tax=Cupriavidus TaxID=106589 RepID=A0A976BA55_9BURK|nr:Tn3 family transposase [Cupriavidus oxalaticus]QRQ85920.1 Tn3 family transposase [Cupriavidus oxalaticus]QRQ95754.1 Tn3 family transposase [Cupriavidus oxalaticus]WQD84420.1 Tn3 family transposase [Cupriavidus oxalaticus]SPC12331.1 transposase [Cupriavidus oxalaticus]